jgi:hypothetical protein
MADYGLNCESELSANCSHAALRYDPRKQMVEDLSRSLDGNLIKLQHAHILSE